MVRRSWLGEANSRGRRLLVATALALTACEPTRSSSTPSQPTEPARTATAATEFSFAVDARLRELQAQVCPVGYHSSGLDAPTERAEDLLDAPPTPAQGCLRYRVDLERALAVESGLTSARRVGESLLVSPDLWLWEPLGRPRDTPVFAHFQGALRQRLAVPWPELEPGRFRLPESQFSMTSQAAIGVFDRQSFEVDGAGYDVVTLGGAATTDQAPVRRWLRSAARAQRQLFREPRGPRPLLLLVPEPGRRELFGYVVRGGGPTVTVLMPRDPADETLREDWTLVHELVHVGLPDVRREDAWFYEGVATYYTYLLRARVGLISEERAWANLFDGFARGAAHVTGNTLEHDSRRMHELSAYWRVYWAGAAFVTDAEIELGKRNRSFDDAMRELSRCCLEREHESAMHLLGHLDEWLGESLLVPLGEAHLQRTGFPDMQRFAEWFGVRTTGVDSCAFDEAARGAGMRHALSRP